jgi:hypothetical protein
VGVFTRRRLNHYDDGHVLMEVRLREGWTVFDLDNNRMAQPEVGITELVRDPRWRLITHDEPYDKAEVAAEPHPNYERAMFRHLDRWYRRVLACRRSSATTTPSGSTTGRNVRAAGRSATSGRAAATGGS